MRQTRQIYIQITKIKTQKSSNYHRNESNQPKMVFEIYLPMMSKIWLRHKVKLHTIESKTNNQFETVSYSKSDAQMYRETGIDLKKDNFHKKSQCQQLKSHSESIE